MKIKQTIMGILMGVLGAGCTAPEHLPRPQNVVVSPFGSYVIVNRVTGRDIKGELIAIDSTKLLVLTKAKGNKLPVIIQTGDIRSFKLRYARPEGYGWRMPVASLAPLSHGWWMLLTIPVNVIVITAVSASGVKAYTYKEKDISMENLKMFARFPQGIPPNIDPTRIK